MKIFFFRTIFFVTLSSFAYASCPDLLVFPDTKGQKFTKLKTPLQKKGVCEYAFQYADYERKDDAEKGGEGGWVSAFIFLTPANNPNDAPDLRVVTYFYHGIFHPEKVVKKTPTLIDERYPMASFAKSTSEYFFYEGRGAFFSIQIMKPLLKNQKRSAKKSTQKK